MDDVLRRISVLEVQVQGILSMLEDSARMMVEIAEKVDEFDKVKKAIRKGMKDGSFKGKETNLLTGESKPAKAFKVNADT